jgi:hypothetical protein
VPTKQRHGMDLHERFEIQGIEYQEAYGLDSACADVAKKRSERRRRAETGIHGAFAIPHCLRYS